MKSKTINKGKDLQKVYEYIWSRYVECSNDSLHDLDDDSALEVLEDHFSRVALETNNEFFYYGFLLFELAFERPEKKVDYLSRAKVVLDKYRRFSGETDWEELEDRLYDINEQLEELGLLTKVEAAGELLLDPENSVDNIISAQQKFPTVPDNMVLIPEGAFKSGEENEEKFLSAFLIDKVPVTNARYDEFLKQAGYRKPKFWSDSRFNRPEQPVVGISLMDAIKFARWAGAELPTDEQYEKAARGTDGRLYPWGDEIVKDSTDFDQDPEIGASLDVGSFPGNQSPYGSLDMAGTVWEWTNTVHPTEENCRVIRGGSWCDPDLYMVTHQSLHANVREKADNLGFRLVKNQP